MGAIGVEPLRLRCVLFVLLGTFFMVMSLQNNLCLVLFLLLLPGCLYKISTAISLCMMLDGQCIYILEAFWFGSQFIVGLDVFFYLLDEISCADW